MSDSEPFRAPVQRETPSETPSETTRETPTSSATAQTDDTPPSLSMELEKKPYAVKFLDLDLYHDDKDFDEVREQASLLDEYVLKQLKAQGLKDDKGSYKEVIDAIYKQIGRSSNEDPVKALKRLATAAGAIERLESAKLQPILSAKNLSVTEYEGIQA